MTTQHAERLAPVQPAADACNTSARTVWRLLEAGHVTRYRAGHRTLVDVDELAAFLAPRPVN